jgi:hypothetical protein
MRDKDARSWCRIGEALALDWSNVRLHEQSARIGMSKNGETPGHSIIGHYANAFSGKSSVLFQQFYVRGSSVMECRGPLGGLRKGAPIAFGSFRRGRSFRWFAENPTTTFAQTSSLLAHAGGNTLHIRNF